MRLSSTINSWNFFLDDAPGDALAQLSQILNCSIYSPEGLLDKLFERYCGGKELSYEQYLLYNLGKRSIDFGMDPTIENMEDAILSDVVYSAIKRCTEDEKDLLVDLLGFKGGLGKKEIGEELSLRASSMDRFLLPAILMLLVDTHYYRELSYAKWSFWLDPQQLSTLASAGSHARIGNEVLAIVVLISCRRNFVYSENKPAPEEAVSNERKVGDAGEDICSIPEDIISNSVGTIFTLFHKHRDLLDRAIDAFVKEGYLGKEDGKNSIRWIKEPWKRQEFACWITELSYLMDADKEKDYRLIKLGSFCKVSTQTFLSSFSDLPAEFGNDNLRDAVSQYRRQITHIHDTDLSSQYTPDELYRFSVKKVIETDVRYWNKYDNDGQIAKRHDFKRYIYRPILALFDKIRRQ